MKVSDVVGVALVLTGLCIVLKSKAIGTGMAEDMPSWMLFPFSGSKVQRRYWVGFGLVLMVMGVAAVVDG